MKIKKVGIVGCGLMGSGIAEVCARSGYDVLASEVAPDILKKGIARIEASTEKAVRKGKASEEDRTATFSRIKGTTDMNDFSDCDLVIEAVIEDIVEKKKVFAKLDKICPPRCILASNTSCLSVIDMAAMTRRPEKVLGLHFFSPVPVMKLLEIVRTISTDDETIKTAQEFGQSIGKTTVLCKDVPGFIVNRLYLPSTLVAIRALEAGMASKEDIDKAMVLGLNYPMGPFTLMDFVGLDIHYHACMAIYEETKDPAYFPPPLLKKMIAAGYLGRKTGKGFYEYNK
ncbi:MAG: 3-hydroxybutyryl-CoA dehydrogenase [Chloroflexota bacterium]|nr:3-hydroxybutyryl-CoA dehydrogenase [Chloroflexota bacterium]